MFLKYTNRIKTIYHSLISPSSTFNVPYPSNYCENENIIKLGITTKIRHVIRIEGILRLEKNIIYKN